MELQKLILAHNDIESLKDDIINLPLLAVLNISYNKLSHLPAAIGEYATLTETTAFGVFFYLACAQCADNLCFTFFRLQSLKSLDVSFNSILKIPEEIGSATALVK